MPFIAHTSEDIMSMLADIGCNSIEDLYAEIPKQLQVDGIDFPPRMTEMQVINLLQQRAKHDQVRLNFIGAGCYEHFIPAAVWDITMRGEFLTAYTPYQPEASQGILQVLYEYQSLMANLTALDVSNASLYDGATALAEAILMAVRCADHPTNKKILFPATIHPLYKQVVQTLVSPQQIELIEVPFDLETGKINQEVLEQYVTDSFVAMVVPQPNFFGVLDDVDFFTNRAHAKGALVIGLVNPISLGLLKAPGNWGQAGVDIACGEAQSLGVPLSSGGPYIGFLSCKKELIRQLPGRLVGVTNDTKGRRGFTLTLQAREQHIRRGKATSNICTNQGLLTTAICIYLSLMGAEGLKQIALQSHVNTIKLKEQIAALPGFKILFNSKFFHEFVVSVPIAVESLQKKLAIRGMQAGFNISKYYPTLPNALLCCVTETKSDEDIKQFVQELATC